MAWSLDDKLIPPLLPGEAGGQCQSWNWWMRNTRRTICPTSSRAGEAFSASLPRPRAGEGKGEGNSKRSPSDSLAPSDGERAGVRGQSNREPLAAEDAANYGGEFARKRTEQSFLVPKADIAAQGYDLSLNRYKEVVHEEVAHRPPGEILASPRQTGGGDSAGHEGTGGDAEVSRSGQPMAIGEVFAEAELATA